MNGTVRFTSSLRRSPFVCKQCRRHLSVKTFKEGDNVILEPVKLLSKGRQSPSVFSKPLKPTLRIETHRGVFLGSDILGKNVRDIVSTSNGSEFRIMEPTLADYVCLTPRQVTPVRTYLIGKAHTLQLIFDRSTHTTRTSLLVSSIYTFLPLPKIQPMIHRWKYWKLEQAMVP
jgi:hypothetical protein